MALKYRSTDNAFFIEYFDRGGLDYLSTDNAFFIEYFDRGDLELF